MNSSTYKFTLPNNKKVKETSLKIEGNQLIFNIEYEDKFEPKDGDFLISSKGFIFIYNGKSVYDSYGCYCGVNSLNNIQFNNLGCIWDWTRKTGCRYATKLEKYVFLERLKEECGKKWNEEKRCLEDIRWKPKKGEHYYYIEYCGIIRGANNMTSCDLYRINNNNCFKTEEAARPYADQIREIFKNSKAE